jgi:hypothetical protein
MKPQVKYADFQQQRVEQDDAWSAAFARIQEGQKLSAGGINYLVSWKHFDPDWVELTFREGNHLPRKYVRKGDPLLLELKP